MSWRPMPWGKVGKSFLLVILVLFLSLSAFLWYLTTDSFQQIARRRLIAAIENATGGHVEMGSFHTVPLRLQVEIRDLTIHGREAAGEQPYAHVDRLVGVISLYSALGAKLAFHSLMLQHPVIHIIFYHDGSTNQPAPARQGNTDLESLFSFSARRLELRKGELQWQDQRLPLDFTSDNVSANLNYSYLRLRYSGDLIIGRVENQFPGLRPIAWTCEARFSLDRTGLRVQSLKAISERSELRASDVRFDFRNLTADGKYDLNLDLAQAGAVARQPQLKEGTLHILATGSWARSGFVSEGEFTLRDLALQDSMFSERDLSGNGHFSLDEQKILLSQVQGQWAHGSFSGDAQVVNWQATRGSPRNQEQQAVIRMKLKDLSLSGILAGLRPSFGVNKLKYAGNVSGNADIRWRQSPRYAQANIAVDVTPPAKVSRDEIPFSARAAGTYDLASGNVTLKEFAANTSASQIHASGSLDSSVKVSFSTDRVYELQPILARLFPAGTPVVVNGHAAFNGTVSGRSSNLRLAGNLQLQDFMTVASSSQYGARQVHWDSLVADVQLSSSNLDLHNAFLRQGETTITIAGTAGLVGWNLAPASALQFQVGVQNANVAELASLAAHRDDISGQLSGAFQLKGTRARPQAKGTFRLEHVVLAGQKFDSVNASVRLSDSHFGLSDIQMVRGDARVSGAGTYDLNSKAFDLNIHGSRFDIAELPIFADSSKVKLAGTLNFSAQASGTPYAPQVTADLQLQNVALNGEPEGNLSLTVVSHGADGRITGRSDLKDADLQMDGTVRLRDEWLANMDFHFAHLNADPFIQSYTHRHLVRHSIVAGDVQLSGPLRNPEQLNVTGDLSDFYADIGKTSFRNDGPIRFALANRVFKVSGIHIVGENTDFSGAGSVQLAGNRAVDFQANGRADLKFIQTYDPDIASSGTLSGEGKITGTIDAPQVKGTLRISNGAVTDVNVPSALSDVNGVLSFSQNQVMIEQLSAHVGGGTVGFTGQATLANSQLNFDVNATANSVRLRYPPGVSSTADARLHWAGSSSGSLLSGDITVTKLAFTPGFDFGAYLERTAEISSLPQTDPVLNTIRLDLHVTTTPELQMQTSVIRLQGSADMRVRGSAAKPILLGRADVYEGQAYFNGTKYRLERGGVSFSNPAVTTPFLDLEAVTRIRDYDVTLSLTGDVSKPNGLKVNYRSDPPLPTSDIIALLAFGQTTEESAQLQQGSAHSAFNNQASNAMLAAALNATLSNRAQRLFGNSRIKINPQGIESETSTTTQNGPAVTIEQQVKDNLTLSYTTDVSQTSQQIIRGEYNVSRNISIVGIRDQNGVVSFDIEIRRRKR